MPNKTQEYLNLAQQTAKELTRYWENWTDYLTTASRLYKYSFADQLMIYAQRPDATACASFDIWNNRIYFVRLDNRTGSEQSGTRPAVILQNDVGNSCSPTLIVATLTSKTEKKATQPTHCLVEPEGLEPSIVQAEQIFTIDKSRVKRFVGHLTPEEMGRVDDAVKISLALNPMGSIQKLKPIIRSTAAYAPPEVVDGKPPVYPYTPIKSDFEDAGTVEEMMLYTELQSAVHAMIQRLEYSFTFNPSLLTSPKRKKQVTEILTEAEKYIWRIKEEIRCA